MFSESAELYDAIYSSFKNYAAESAAIAKLIRDVAPNARTILDVACGTGEHAKHTAALRCFRNHLTSDGVIVVEPWFPRGFLQDGYKSTTRAQVNGTDIERVSTTRIDGGLSTILFDYRIEDAGGVRTMQEMHELGLFSPVEMLSSFEAAQLTATDDAVGLTDRGLYVARSA